jgi:hypothetical protein
MSATANFPQLIVPDSLMGRFNQTTECPEEGDQQANNYDCTADEYPLAQ